LDLIAIKEWQIGAIYENRQTLKNAFWHSAGTSFSCKNKFIISVITDFNPVLVPGFVGERFQLFPAPVRPIPNKPLKRLRRLHSPYTELKPGVNCKEVRLWRGTKSWIQD
jgi:hypothetical protein